MLVSVTPNVPLRVAKDQFVREYLTVALTVCGGKICVAAKLLDVDRPHLYRLVRDHNIDVAAIRGTK